MRKEEVRDDKVLDKEEEKDLNSKKSTSKGGKKSGSRRGKKKFRKGGRNEKIAKEAGGNDVSWYAKNPQVLASAANLSYYTPLGGSYTYKNLPTDFPAYSAPSFRSNLGSFPGVMALEYIHGPAADSNMETEPLDIAANNIYSFIRHANSGAKNADAPDYMMYLLAMDEVYQAWAIGVRAYGLLRLYSQTNRYLPKMLVEAAGFDFDDLKGNMANFNNYLNVMAAQIAAFCVPANIPYFNRHYYLASSVFVDEDVTKPQMYLYRPALYRYWSDYLSDQGSTLVAGWWPYHDQQLGNPTVSVDQDWTTYFNFINVQSDPELDYHTPAGNKAKLQAMKMTFQQYRQILDNMVYTLNGSSDVGLISGDILKAYGQSNLFTLSPIPTDYVVMPVKNEESLTQISNFKAVTGFNYFDTDANFHNSMDIRQIVGTEEVMPQIDYNPSTTAHAAKFNLCPNIINFHKSEVTPEDTMVASRWLNVLSQVEVRDESTQELLGYKYDFFSVGSEFGTGIYVYTLIPDGAISWNNEVYTERVDHFTSFTNYAEIASFCGHFDWHMPIYLTSAFPTNPTDAVSIQHLFYDIANFTYPTAQAISNMNQCAILSMFDVPQIGTF